MNDKLAKCRKCKGEPFIKVYSDLFYVQCHCGKWDPFEFCGATRKGAIYSWNEINDKDCQLLKRGFIKDGKQN